MESRALLDGGRTLQGQDANPGRIDARKIFGMKMKVKNLPWIRLQVDGPLKNKREGLVGHRGGCCSKSAFWPRPRFRVGFRHPLGENQTMSFADWKKVLVVDLGFLGDTVHSIPAIRALALAGKKVDVMTTPVGADLLSLVPEVHKTWTVPLQKPSPPFWKNLGTLMEIRRQKYDAAVTFSGADRNLFCTAASGAGERIAVEKKKGGWISFLPLTGKLPHPHREQALFLQRLESLQNLGWAAKDPGWSWEMSSQHPQRRKDGGGGKIYLSVSAFGSPLKEWPLGHWAETVRLVWKEKPGVPFVVGFAAQERERRRALHLSTLLGHPADLHVMGAPPRLAELVSLLAECDLFAGLDSGVLHLAVSLGKPTVSIFRDYAGKKEWLPLGQNHRALMKACECDFQGKNLCGDVSQCLGRVSPEEAARAILDLLTAPSRKS